MLRRKSLVQWKAKKEGADEVAVIVGAPKGALLMDIVRALHEMDAEKGLKAVSLASKDNLDMKLFMRLLLERIRAVILLRNAPGEREDILASFAEGDMEDIEMLAKDKTSSINSHMLLRLLDAAEMTGKTHIAQLPLELAIVDLTQ